MLHNGDVVRFEYSLYGGCDLGWTGNIGASSTATSSFNTCVDKSTLIRAMGTTGLSNTHFFLAALGTLKDFNATASQVANVVNIIPLPEGINLSEGDWGGYTPVTANTTLFDGLSVSDQKWALGNQDIAYFATNGTEFTGNSFKANQNGIYTVYVKDSASEEYTKTVTVDHVLGNVPFGNYNNSCTDLTINSTGIPTTFGRIYNSTNTSIGPFGKGWTFTYCGSVKDCISTYTDENGTTHTYTVPGLKTVSMPDGNLYVFHITNGPFYGSYSTRDILHRNPDGTFALKAPNKQWYQFNSNGYLTAIVDKNGNRENIVVDSNGKVQSVTDTAGRTYTVSYTDGLISSISDPTGRSVKYGYTNGELTSVTDPMGLETNQYSYDAAGYLSQIKNSLGNITWAGTYHDTADATKGYLLSDTDSGTTYTYAYDLTNNTVTKKNSQKTIVTTYNQEYEPTSVQTSNGSITYTYADSYYGDIASTTDSNGATTFQYDSAGNKIKVTNPDGTSRTSTYDTNGNLLTQKTSEDSTTYYEYDSNNNVVLEAVPKNGTDVYSDSADQSKFNITIAISK